MTFIYHIGEYNELQDHTIISYDEASTLRAEWLENGYQCKYRFTQPDTCCPVGHRSWKRYEEFYSLDDGHILIFCQECKTVEILTYERH